MERITEEEVAKARDKNLADFLGIQMRGRHTKVRCPFHNSGHERTPSCAIYRDNSYHCFGCGVNGYGAISFLMELGDSFPEAVSRLLE